jgi:Zn-dependent peptidase ImmA (M78 family)
MNSASDRSIGGLLLEGLQTIWGPAAEAHRVREQLRVRSLDDSIAAIERAGYDVHAVDLPAAVQGFPMQIDDTRCIVVNRAASLARQQYTVVHELAHHVLHLADGRISEPPKEPTSSSLAEFQAHLFTATWIAGTDSTSQRNEVLRQNREASASVFVSVVLSVGMLAGALLIHLIERFSVSPKPAQ